VAWTRTAAEQGLAEAQNNLGVMYDKGHGVAQDDVQAVEWYRKAAGQGYVQAQYNLGMMYGMGRGVPQDYGEAYVWLSLAAAQGDEDAAKLRYFAASELTPSALSRAKARAAAERARLGRGAA
jgi:TPR repeat protein